MLRWLRSWVDLLRRWWVSRPTPPPPRGRSVRLSAPESLEDRSVPAAVPAGFQDVVFVGGLLAPTSMTFAPDGRVFVAEKTGRLRVVKNGALLPAPFLSVATNSFSERGLGGVAVDPNFAQNGFVYVYYTTATPIPVNRLSRFTVSPGNSDVADPNSETVLLDGIPSPTGRHNGGALQFGPDGMLYVGVGDGGRSSRAQRLGSIAGKVLRLNVSRFPNLIPADNPFVRRRGARPEIWATGFRNPFTAAFIPGTDLLFVNDVGEVSFEEVNVVRRGRNYGWPLFEGPGGRAGFVGPRHAYRHPPGGGAAIAGGAFLNGSYFFADFVQGFIRRLGPSRAARFATGAATPVDLDAGPDGNLYYLSFRGAIHVIRPG